MSSKVRLSHVVSLALALALAVIGTAAVHADPATPQPSAVSTHDVDGDGLLDIADNCPTLANGDQRDTDGDGHGDACDTDRDGDGVLNVFDNCPTLANSTQDDLNGDGIGDRCEMLVAVSP